MADRLTKEVKNYTDKALDNRTEFEQQNVIKALRRRKNTLDTYHNILLGGGLLAIAVTVGYILAPIEKNPLIFLGIGIGEAIDFTLLQKYKREESTRYIQRQKVLQDAVERPTIFFDW